jgi:hypothetical protein
MKTFSGFVDVRRVMKITGDLKGKRGKGNITKYRD